MLTAGKSIATVRNNLAMARSVFDVAVQNRHVRANPVAGIKASTARRQGEETQPWEPFSLEEARTLLLAARSLPAPQRWAVWLMALTGARMNEVLQADVTDFGYEDGIPFLAIHGKGPDKSLKNRHSRRRIALHPSLIKEGLFDYLAKLPQDGPAFGDIPMDSFGKRSGTFTKTYSRWQRGKVGITDKLKVAHSWRHFFEDQARGAGMQEDVRERYVGHQVGSKVGNRYGHGIPLAVFAEAVAKIPALLPGPRPDGVTSSS
jgi:integrase